MALLIDVRTVNVVASTKLDTTLNLETLYRSLSHVQYEPEIFAGLIYRREKPKATIIIFSTGRIVSVGTNSEETAKSSLRETLNEMGMRSHAPIYIENVVAVADLRKTIDIEKFIRRDNPFNRVFYEPEQFPGLICRYKGVVFLIFHTGKITVVGAKAEKQARRMIRRISAFL